MPLALEPGIKNPVWLKIDDDKPEGIRPTFFVQAQSMRGQRVLAEKLDELFSSARAEGDATPATIECQLVALLSGCVVGWKNMKRLDGSDIPFSVEAFIDILTTIEGIELVQKVLSYGRQTAEEKKSSE